MKKIVIYRDETVNEKKVRTTLRSIAPGPDFIGFTKNGNVIAGEVKKLCGYLEPSYTGFSVS